MNVAYFARPIDQATDMGSVHRLTTSRIGEILAECGLTVYNPATAWWVPPGVAMTRKVEQINRAALAASSLVVAYLPKGVPSIGVPMEIEYATHLRIPVGVVTDVRSYALHDRPGVDVFDNTSDFVQWVDRLELPARRHTGEILVTYDSDRPHNPDTRSYDDDAGIDLVTADPVIIPAGQYRDIPTRITGVQLPADTWGMITGRSSTLRKLGLHVPVSVIDPGWRGPLMVGAYNLGRVSVTVEPGQRIGQMVCIRNRTADLSIRVVDKLDPHLRGLNGFGSTGTH